MGLFLDQTLSRLRFGGRLRLRRTCLVLFFLLAFLSCVHSQAAPSNQSLISPRTFTHPGLLNSKDELDFVKNKITSGAEPWSRLFHAMKNSKYADPNWVPKPLEVVNARSEEANVELEDATAAYTLALLWYFTAEEVYARKSVAILNAWSGKLNRHTSHDRQAELVAAWCAADFALAGEIIRASYPQWAPAEIGRFSTMLNQAFLPILLEGNPKYNGNWELTMIDAIISIGVFTDNDATFERGVLLWRERVPAYFYLASDGKSPRRPPGTHDLDSERAIKAYWYQPDHYIDGLCQETGRDFGHHMQEGLASAVNAAEIALHQGIDLYAENADRISEAMEFHARPLLGRAIPKVIFPRDFLASEELPTWEIAYNHFHYRKGFILPATKELIETRVRSTLASGTHNNMLWEGLTHAELGYGGDGKSPH